MFDDDLRRLRHVACFVWVWVSSCEKKKGGLLRATGGWKRCVREGLVEGMNWNEWMDCIQCMYVQAREKKVQKQEMREESSFRGISFLLV